MVKSMNGEIDRSEVKRKGGRKKLNKVLREMIGTLVYLLIVLCMVLFVVRYVGQRTECSRCNMTRVPFL